jgi:acetoin utilization deacetylase AcuC-like enzyme
MKVGRGSRGAEEAEGKNYPLLSSASSAPLLAFSPSHITVPLPEGHRFPMSKYRALVERLTPLGWQIEKAPRATLEDLQLVHTAEF